MIKKIIFGNILGVYGTLDNHFTPHGSPVYDFNQIHKVLFGFEAADKLGVIWWTEREGKNRITIKSSHLSSPNIFFAVAFVNAIWKSVTVYYVSLWKCRFVCFMLCWQKQQYTYDPDYEHKTHIFCNVVSLTQNFIVYVHLNNKYHKEFNNYKLL